MATVSVFYNSSQAQSMLSQRIVQTKYPNATFFDTNGLDTTAIDAQIATIGAASQNKIFVLVNVGTNPPAGNLTAGQIGDLDAKLSTAPGSDAATTEIDETSGTGNSVKNRALLTWENVYPNDTPAYAVEIMGRRNFYVVQFTSTASSGAATSITDSGATFLVDSLVDKFVAIVSGTGAGQIRKILNNSATAINIYGSWATNPDNTSVYEIRGYLQNPVLVASGTATSGSGATITNTGAGFTVDALIGYVVEITGGTGAGQVALITDNSATVITTPENFAVTPDNTSVYRVMNYGLNNENEKPFEEGDATAGAASSITDSTQSWPVNGWAGLFVKILSGTGAGQIRRIASNTATVLTVTNAWGTNPDATSVYQILNYSGNWNYVWADYYLELALGLPSNTDITSTAQIEKWRRILGKRTFSETQTSSIGNAQSLDLLALELAEGKTIFDYNNPSTT